MVFGMNLGNRRKATRVPDLSRYDYHYNGSGGNSVNQGDNYLKSHELSADAAFAASARAGSLVNYPERGYTNISRANSLRMGHPGQQQQQSSYIPRSYSFTARGAYAPRTGNVGNRRSVSAIPRTGTACSRGVGSRTGSMTGSVARVGSRTGSFAGGGNGSIIIKTQEVKDMMGRTQSITTQTIRRINGMEYVETTTQTAGLVEDPQFHFQQFAENDEFPISDELSATPPAAPLSESQPRTNQRLANFNSNAINNSAANNIRSDSEEEGEEHFTDASDVVEESGAFAEDDQDHFLAKVNKVDVDNNSKSYTSRKPLVQKQGVQQQQEVQHQGISQVQNTEAKSVGRKSTMSKRMTLRDTPNAQLEPEKDTTDQATPDNNATKRKSIFKSKKRNEAVAVPTVPTSDQKTLSQEEMYAIALEIAQQKYGHPTKTVSHSTDNGSRNEMTPILEDADVEQPHVLPTTLHLPTREEQIQHEQLQQPTAAIPTNEKSRHPKKKVKSILDRVVQFSQENSGNQPPKQHRGKQYSQQPPDVAPSNGTTDNFDTNASGHNINHNNNNHNNNNNTSSSSSLRHESGANPVVVTEDTTVLAASTAATPVDVNEPGNPDHVIPASSPSIDNTPRINEKTKSKKKNEKGSFFKRLFKSNKTHINTK